MNYYINSTEEFSNIINKVNNSKNCEENVTEIEQISFKTTDDESMAVEALRQLGGMYPNVVTTEETLPMLSCNICAMKFHTTSDLRTHAMTCRSHIYQNFNCSMCNLVFNDAQDYNDHKCFNSKLPCKYCYTYFVSRIELEKHIEANHNNDRPYKCGYCNMAFPRSSSLANHLKIHNYLPGRALMPTNVSTWNFESTYVPDETVNNSTDTVSNWNLEYTSNPLISLESNDDLGTISQEIIVPTEFPQQSTTESNPADKNKIDSNTDFQIPVKIEAISQVTDIVTSIPQLEVTIETDSKKLHICSACGMSFSREKALISHIKLHSMNWSLKHECENCGQTFSDDNSIQQHKKSCGILNQTFEHNIQYENKKNTKVSNTTKPQVKVGKHPCPECDKHFTTKQKMYRHLWIHRKKTFTCELCAMTFAVQAELDKHRLSQHPADSPYVCSECGKSFASRQGLWEHGRVHGGGSAGLFTCDKCKKTFASRQGYLIHHRTHTDERPYGCRYCLKAFRDGGTLRKHERIHTGYRPYVCPLCSHDFNQKVVLREHVRWVHAANNIENEDGMFVCELCNLSISDREELCAHIVKHSDMLTLEAKYNLKNKSSNTNVNNDIRKKNVRSRTNNIIKVENISTEEIIKQEKIDLNLEDCNSFTANQHNVECDLCGNKFSSQKDLVTHVHIHI